MVRSSKLPITRRGSPGNFSYYANGTRLRSKKEIARIERLAIPPAWINVEIGGPRARKIIARGIDEAGRTQAIYSDAFLRRQSKRKYDRMVQFAERLPRLRAKIDTDMRARSLTKRRVVACVVHLIDRELFRIGSPQYAQEHNSFGITTVQHKHLTVKTTSAEFSFTGKSGVPHTYLIRDARTVRILSQLSELAGDTLFQYVSPANNNPRPVRSEDINRYIKNVLGKNFSAKDFRTWGGTVAAASHIIAAEPDDLSTPQHRTRIFREAVKHASERLKNTPTVAKSSYIDPRIFSAAEHTNNLHKIRRKRLRERKNFSVQEQGTLALIRLAQSRRRDRK